MPTLFRSLAAIGLFAIVFGLAGCSGAEETGGEKPKPVEPTGGADAATGGEKPKPADPTPAKSDAELIQGVWTLQWEEHGWQEHGKDKLYSRGDNTFTITGEKLVAKHGNQTTTASFKLDPTKSPRAIDISFTEGGRTGVALGIYELNGDDLKLCLAGRPKAARPKAFGATETETQVLKRGLSPLPTPAEADIKAGIVGKWTSGRGATEFFPLFEQTEFTKDGRVLKYDRGTKKWEEKYQYRVEKSDLFLVELDKKRPEQRFWIVSLTADTLTCGSPRGEMRRMK